MTRYSKMVQTLRKNYTYTLDQLHKAFDLHPQTVRGWIKRSQNSLKCIQRNPTFVFSEELRGFLKRENQNRKTILEPTHMFCMSCKKGKHPLDNQVYFQFKGKAVSLKAICPGCHVLMNKQTSSRTLNQIMPLYQKVTREALDILRINNKLEETQNRSLEQSVENDVFTFNDQKSKITKE